MVSRNRIVLYHGANLGENGKYGGGDQVLKKWLLSEMEKNVIVITKNH